MNSKKQSKKKAGRKPKFTDSEMLTLMLAQDLIPYASEMQFLEYIQVNHLYPNLLDQGQFVRRTRFLRMSIENIRRFCMTQRELLEHSNYLLDTVPVDI